MKTTTKNSYRTCQIATNPSPSGPGRLVPRGWKTLAATVALGFIASPAFAVSDDVLFENRIRTIEAQADIHGAIWNYDGLDPAAGVGLFYWDPAREVIAGTTVLDQGRLKDMIVEVQEGRLDFKHDYYSGGTTSKWIETFGWDGADSYQYQAFIIGEAPLEWLNLRCAREEEGASALPVMPMDEGESAKLGALEPMMGNWKVTKTDHRNDSVHESRNIVYWGLDRSVILWRDIASVDGVDTPVSDALIYWSPKTSSIELLQVTDSGEVVRASLAENDEGLFGACETVTGVEDDQAEGPGSFMTVTFETDRAGFTISTWRATEDPERRVAETSIVFEPFE